MEQIKQWDPVKRRLWVGAAGFCAVSAIGFWGAGEWLAAWICLGSVILVSLLPLLERWLRWNLSRGFFLCCLLYAMGPMLGKAFKLYYLTNWWDKLLHAGAGFLFAVLGAGLAERLNRGRETAKLLRLLFGICFSVAVSALWELVEFGIDWCFGADMQNDTLVHTIHSYFLSDTPGVLYEIPWIQHVRIDGVPLELEGYLDIGLIDTMLDVLVETLGAAAYGVWYLADRDRHPLIR